MNLRAAVPGLHGPIHVRYSTLARLVQKVNIQRTRIYARQTSEQFKRQREQVCVKPRTVRLNAGILSGQDADHPPSMRGDLSDAIGKCESPPNQKQQGGGTKGSARRYTWRQRNPSSLRSASACFFGLFRNPLARHREYAERGIPGLYRPLVAAAVPAV